MLVNIETTYQRFDYFNNSLNEFSENDHRMATEHEQRVRKFGKIKYYSIYTKNLIFIKNNLKIPSEIG